MVNNQKNMRLVKKKNNSMENSQILGKLNIKEKSNNKPLLKIKFSHDNLPSATQYKTPQRHFISVLCENDKISVPKMKLPALTISPKNLQRTNSFISNSTSKTTLKSESPKNRNPQYRSQINKLQIELFEIVNEINTQFYRENEYSPKKIYKCLKGILKIAEIIPNLEYVIKQIYKILKSAIFCQKTDLINFGCCEICEESREIYAYFEILQKIVGKYENMLENYKISELKLQAEINSIFLNKI